MIDTNGLVEGIKACKRVPKHPTVAWLKAKLVELDKGVLYSGAHTAGKGQFCALEFVNTLLDGVDFTDSEGYTPELNDNPNYMPDLRGLNDHPKWKSNKDRTDHLLPIIAALWTYDDWSRKRSDEFKKRLVSLINEVVFPGTVGWKYELGEDINTILSNIGDSINDRSQLHRVCNGIVSAARLGRS